VTPGSAVTSGAAAVDAERVWQTSTSGGDDAAAARRFGPPDNELPVTVSWTTVLGRTEDLAIALLAAKVYSSGINFELAIRRNGRGADARAERTAELIDGFGPATDRLLLGVEYADGRTATTFGGPEWGEAEPDEPTLVPSGGTGTELALDQTFWLTPLPERGSLTLVCAWPAFDVPETRTVLDGEQLAAALSRVEVLWDPAPIVVHDAEPDDADLPEGSWFAEVARRRKAREAF
jgi:hypothetical protein